MDQSVTLVTVHTTGSTTPTAVSHALILTVRHARIPTPLLVISVISHIGWSMGTATTPVATVFSCLRNSATMETWIAATDVTNCVKYSRTTTAQTQRRLLTTPLQPTAAILLPSMSLSSL